MFSTGKAEWRQAGLGKSATSVIETKEKGEGGRAAAFLYAATFSPALVLVHVTASLCRARQERCRAQLDRCSTPDDVKPSEAEWGKMAKRKGTCATRKETS